MKWSHVLPDALLLAGSASISVGAGLAYLPAGLIVAGLFLIAAGAKLARAV